MENLNTLESKLEETYQELQHLRVLHKKTQDRLGKADDALLFYSKPQNYVVSAKGAQTSLVYQNALKDDFEQASNDANTLIAGRRAREYFEAHAKE